MTGVVTQHLIDLLAKQVEDNSLVVWYDPEGCYTSVAETLELPKTTIARYDGSFFALRQEIDDLLNGQQAPKLIVYVPMERGETHYALVELEKAGVKVQPGQQPPTRNSRLAVVARNALKPILGEETAADVEKQVESGKLSLDELNALATKGEGIAKGVISLIFESDAPESVALGFLASDKLDKQIENKSATGELCALLNGTFALALQEGESLSDLRKDLARHILMTDLMTGLGEAVPEKLAGVPIANNKAAATACQHVAQNWRMRRDLRDSYVEAAEAVEKQIGLAKLPLDVEAIHDVETFPAIERALLAHVEKSLLDTADFELLELARSRLTRFWPDVIPDLRAHWALIAATAEVLLEADRVAEALKKPPATVPTLIKRYTDGKEPWCLLDTHQRHMESRWHDFDPDEESDGLEKLIVKARHRYTEVGSQLAKQFVEKYGSAKHPLKDVLHQRDIYDSQVKPKLDEGKIAYVWVDALRFEMAKELSDLLKDDFDLTLEPAIATIPTITEIGMPSLLPNAAESKLVSVGNGRLALEFGGKAIKARSERVAYLKEQAGVAVFDAKLDDLLPKPKKKVREGIEAADLVLVTSQEIDELCEKDNITQARRQMDGVLNDLRRGVRVLADLGVRTIVMVADHGHIFADEVGDDMKIDAPGGKEADLHRRVWVGEGGTSEPSYMRAPLASLGVASDMDIATPYTFACFKAKGGARAYFHGGLSPQELIVPVVTLKVSASALLGASTNIAWTLSPGTEKLTTRFFSVQVTGISSGLFDLEPPRVRLELRARGKCVSRPVAASYGFEEATGEVELKQSADNPKKIEPNSVTLMVIDDVTQKTVSLSLVDAVTGAELTALDKIENAISM